MPGVGEVAETGGADKRELHLLAEGVAELLLTRGVNWRDASEDDAEEFMFWRLTDPQNTGRVQASACARDLAGLKRFCKIVGKRHGIVNPFDEIQAPRARRKDDVKWLDPDGYTR